MWRPDLAPAPAPAGPLMPCPVYGWAVTHGPAPAGSSSGQRCRASAEAEVCGSARSILHEVECVAAAVIGDECDPQFEDAVDQVLLVDPYVDRAEPDSVHDSLDGGAVVARRREVHVGDPRGKARVGHDLTAQCVEGPCVADVVR